MIVIEGINKRYSSGMAVLKNISLEIHRNEILALLGPSGCGKTTLLRLIAGFETPDSGCITIDDMKASTREHVIQPDRRNISMIFQDLALWPHITVAGHIQYALKNKAGSKQDLDGQTDEILKKVNLFGCNHRLPHQLSGGERQRLAIARSVAPGPDYLLMDEPFSSLDPILREELEGFIAGLKDQLQMGVVYVTHNIDEVGRLADKIAVLNKGDLIQLDTKENIYLKPENDFVRKFLGMSLFEKRMAYEN